jgi:hypothetical protein
MHGLREDTGARAVQRQRGLVLPRDSGAIARLLRPALQACGLEVCKFGDNLLALSRGPGPRTRGKTPSAFA